MTESPDNTVRKRYEDALDAIISKATEDPYVLAVILLGSLSYDVVWEKSDIDLFIVLQEGKHRASSYTLVEHDVNIHAILMTRSRFKQTLEGAVQSSFMHSLMSKGRIVFSRDRTLDELYESRFQLGARDRETRLLSSVSLLLWSLVKAQKWLAVKGDADYSFFWIMKSLDSLASIDVVWHGEITGREVIHQALRLNPTLFQTLYTDLIHGPKDAAVIGEALQTMERYLIEKSDVLFAPIYEYLSEVGGARSATEINEYFRNNRNLDSADSVCEWMADQGMIDKVSTPVRLAERSRVDFQEAAYYYDGAT